MKSSTSETRFSLALDALNHEYESLHTAKEDAFWAAYMGHAEDSAAARAALDERDIAIQRWLQDPERLAAVRALLALAEHAAGDPRATPQATEEQLVSLVGWEQTLRAHVVETSAARALGEQIIAAEGCLAQARGALKLSYRDASGATHSASSVELGTLLRSSTEREVRRSAFEALRSVETHVLANGFVELVRERNRLGRLLGGANYYDARVRRVEGLSEAEVFELLDELERETRAPAQQALAQLAQRQGASIEPFDALYLTSGDSTRELDPYFPFDQAFERWARSFAALGIRYRGASLVLDLVDRQGKYENGFMHGPVPAWREHGEWRPARIQFTANAVPGMLGSGMRATETLFHEGGHAAHFANIDMPSPCFAQEYAPSSVAFAETQSMFLDSLIGDADWLARYASDAAGQPIPWQVVERALCSRSAFAAWNVRAMLAVCYGERAIYHIPEAELCAERILDELRREEQRLLFLAGGSPRPVLSVPHLLSGESSAYYHGYVLAEMAVAQTRAHFLARDGHLTDNPRIGPELARVYWQPGNSRGFSELVEQLCGAPASAQALARELSLPAADLLARERQSFERARALPPSASEPALEARIALVHGRREIASCDTRRFEPREFDAAVDAYAAFIREQERQRAVSAPA